MTRVTLLKAQRERVGQNVRRARLTSGLSHDRLAAQVGSSRQHLIKIEKGMHLPGDALLARIAEVTGTSVEQLTSLDDADEEESHAMTFEDFLARRIDVALTARLEAVLKSNAPAAHLTASTAGASTHGG